MFHAAEYLDDFFAAVLHEVFGKPVPVIGYRFLSGGCIHNTLVLSTADGHVCLKYNETEPLALLQAEADGLKLLRTADALRLPRVLGLGETDGKTWLLLEYIETGRRRDDYWAKLGTGLALLHGHTAPAFGAEADNFIGSLPQPNGWLADPFAFFTQRRILVQAGQALLEDRLSLPLFKDIEALCARFPTLLPLERPALVHGDLWSGNLLVDEQGGPAVIDPAAHYGLREAEIAFTYLFGGFEEPFYQAYQEAFPLEPGFADRMPLYNLYPLLVHLNLFGSGYLSGVEHVVARFA